MTVAAPANTINVVRNRFVRGLVMMAAGLLLVAVAVITMLAGPTGSPAPVAVIGIVFIAVGAQQSRWL